MRYQVENLSEKISDFNKQEDTFFLVGLLNEFMNRFQATADSFFQEMSWKQAFVLICLNLFEEAPTLNELAETMGCSHQNAKQLIIKLEKIGLLRTERDALDRRKQRIYATDKAKMVQQKYDNPSQRVMKKLYQEVSKEDLAITIQTILRMDKNLKQGGFTYEERN